MSEIRLAKLLLVSLVVSGLTGCGSDDDTLGIADRKIAAFNSALADCDTTISMCADYKALAKEIEALGYCYDYDAESHWAKCSANRSSLTGDSALTFSERSRLDSAVKCSVGYSVILPSVIPDKYPEKFFSAVQAVYNSADRDVIQGEMRKDYSMVDDISTNIIRPIHDKYQLTLEQRSLRSDRVGKELLLELLSANNGALEENWAIFREKCYLLANDA